MGTHIHVFANRGDPDETAPTQLFQQDLLCLLKCECYLESWLQVELKRSNCYQSIVELG